MLRFFYSIWIVFATVISISNTMADVGTPHPGKLLAFKNKIDRYVLPLVEAHQYDSFCSALLAGPNEGKPVYVQTGDGGSLGCGDEQSRASLKLFGGMQETCSEITAVRKDAYLGKGTSWNDLFETPLPSQQSKAIALRDAYRMYKGGQSEFRTRYLLMHLPFSDKKTVTQRSEVLAKVGICIDRDQRKAVAEKVKRDRFVVFDPYAPARSAFVFEDLNTPLRLFFSDTQLANTGEETSLGAVSSDRPEWANWIYNFEWNQRRATYSSIVVPKRPTWLEQAENAEKKKVPVVFHTDSEHSRIIVQFPIAIAKDNLQGTATFEHHRLVLPVDNKISSPEDQKKEFGKILEQLIPVSLGDWMHIKVDPVIFNALQQTSLDASYLVSGKRPSEEVSLCNNLPRHVFFRATSPYAPFGDSASYVFRIDIDDSKLSLKNFLRNYCAVLGMFAGNSKDIFNGPPEYYEWYDLDKDARLLNVEFSIDTREVKFSNEESRKVSSTIESSLPPMKVFGYPDEHRNPSEYTRPLLKFVLVNSPSEPVYYAQDFSVSINAALHFFTKEDDLGFIDNFLGGETYTRFCFNEVFNIEILGESVNALNESGKHRISVYTAFKLATFLQKNSGEHWKFLIEGSKSKDCQRERYLIYATRKNGSVPERVLAGALASGFKKAELDKAYKNLQSTSEFTKYKRMGDVVESVRGYFKDISINGNRPLALLSNDDALKIVHGLLGLQTKNNKPDLGFTMYGQKWKLAAFSEIAFRNLIAGKWTLYYPNGETDQKLGDRSEPMDVSFADGGTTHFVPHTNYSREFWHELRELGIHGLLPGPIIKLTGGDNQYSYDQHRVNSAKWTLFSARLMLIQDLDGEPEE